MEQQHRDSARNLLGRYLSAKKSRRLLASELGVGPSAETEAAYLKLLGTDEPKKVDDKPDLTRRDCFAVPFPDALRALVPVKMAGREVFKAAVRSMADAADQALLRSGLTGGDIDLFVPHQANSRIISAQVCQPEAPSPPSMVLRAASSSRCIGCGSYCAAKPIISRNRSASALFSRSSRRAMLSSVIVVVSGPGLLLATQPYRRSRGDHPLWIAGLPTPDSWWSLQQASSPQLLHHHPGRDPPS